METINSGNSHLDSKVSEYLQFAAGLETAKDVKRLLEEKRFDILEDVMMERLTFGTAGLRGPMGPGYAAMNDLVIVQTSQGVAAYLQEVINSSLKKSVVIGFDNRHNSERFAHLVAVAFLSSGFKVYLFSKMVPTPFIPYSVRHLRCFAGIMVTASHNPKEDNGYKVYWSNGAQILPPHDKNIQESILKHLKPWPQAFNTSLTWTSPNCIDPSFDVPLSYFHELKEKCHMDDLSQLGYKNLKITFTAMHGVSHSYIKKAFQMLNFENYVPVVEQMIPDANFPTVVFPNPEERNCLNHSIATAEANGSRLILANDPDVDRLAVAEKLHNNSWHIYSGNEIGALLGSWLWETLSPQYKSDPGNCCMISSTVSSKILRSISEVEGFRFVETLTGFKWMANKACELIVEGKQIVLAFEEAIGYMCGTMVLDKDGIIAAMQMTKMAAYAYSNGKILHDLLRDVYKKYGFHVSCNSYFICHDPAKISSMFSRLRNFDGPNQYPKFLGETPYHVSGVRDLTTGYDSTQPDKRAVLPHSSSSQMITFYFKNGCEATIRTSGTEPKVKYYTEMIAKVPEEEWAAVNVLLQTMVQLIVENWMEPEKNGFQPRPS